MRSRAADSIEQPKEIRSKNAILCAHRSKSSDFSGRSSSPGNVRDILTHSFPADTLLRTRSRFSLPSDDRLPLNPSRRLAWILILCEAVYVHLIRAPPGVQLWWWEDGMLQGLFFDDYPFVAGCLIVFIYVFVMYQLIKDARP
jgi:hypothetical protein